MTAKRKEVKPQDQTFTEEDLDFLNLSNEYNQNNPSSHFNGKEKELIDFIEEQIQKMKKIYTLGNSTLITFDELNKALINYFNIQLSLLSLYSQLKMEFQIAEEDFNNWYADKYILVRSELNPRTISAQKWYSQKEIEFEVINRYKKEYNQYKQNLLNADLKLSFIRRLIDGWTTQSYILSTLSKNLISEKNGSEVDTKIPNMLNKEILSLEEDIDSFKTSFTP